MSEYQWTCAGCGVPSPNKMRSCDCPTNVVEWDRVHGWKADEPGVEIDQAALSAAQQIADLPREWPRTRRVAAVQVIITNALHSRTAAIPATNPSDDRNG